MDAQEFRGLQEAYMEVVENQQLDEAAKVTRIRGEFKKPQPLNPLPKSPRKSGIEKLEKGREAYNKSREVASRNLMRQKESVDLYDIILSHLLDEGYAETPEAAEAIMVNMSEDWRGEIIDEALTGDRAKKAIKKPGGTAYTRMVSADPAKRATRGGRGGESDFGAGDRGSGNRAARRAGTYRED